MTTTEKSTATKERSVWELLGLVWEIGWMIAVPAFVLGFGGAYLDKNYLHMEPLGVIAGLALALFISGFAVYTRVRSVLK